MKKIYLSSALLGASLFASAQITVSQWDVVMPGKQIIQARDTLKENNPGAINPGPAGANQTWNFSTLGAHVIDTLTATNPNWLANGPQFPGSNLALVNFSDGSEFYLDNKATGMWAIGFYGDPIGVGTMTVKYDDSEQLAKFNDTYGTTFQDTALAEIEFAFSQLPGVDSIKVKHMVFKDFLTDGWGNITTPAGTYPSLRHRGRVISVDSIFAHPIGPPQWVHIGAPYSPTVDTVWHFTWWGNKTANTLGFPILEFDSARADSIRNITWLQATIIGGVNDAAAALSIRNVYPNPSADVINFEITNADVSAIEFFNLAGKKIDAISVNGKTASYNASHLTSGIYFYRAVDAGGNTLSKGKIEVVR